MQYQPTVDKVNITVPCGKCEQCRNKIQEDWFLRIYTEIKNARSSAFVTLTYSEDNVPKITLPNGVTTTCFRKADFKNFMDQLRRSFYRGFGRVKIPYGSMKFFCASEFGTDPRFTRRPHYHLLLCFYSGNELTHKDINEFDLYKDIVRYWKGGDISPQYNSDGSLNMRRSKTGLMIVNKLKSAQYVSKYVTKDVGFYQKPEIQAWLDLKLKKDNYAEYKDRYEFIKAYLPSHYQSHGFGIALYHLCLRDNDIIKFGLHFPDYPSKSYRIPPYIMDKLFYRAEKVSDFDQKVRVLTDFGKKWFKTVFESKIHRTSEFLSQYFVENRILSFSDKFILKKFGRSRQSLFQYMNSLLAGRSFDDLAIYSQVYKDTLISQYCDSIKLSYLDDKLKFLRDHAFDTYVSRLKTCVCHDSIEEISTNDGKKFCEQSVSPTLLYVSKFNTLHCFLGFDELLQIINILTCESYRVKALERAKRDALVKKLRSFSKNYN